MLEFAVAIPDKMEQLNKLRDSLEKHRLVLLLSKEEVTFLEFEVYGAMSSVFYEEKDLGLDDDEREDWLERMRDLYWRYFVEPGYTPSLLRKFCSPEIEHSVKEQIAMSELEEILLEIACLFLGLPKEVIEL